MKTTTKQDRHEAMKEIREKLTSANYRAYYLGLLAEQETPEREMLLQLLQKKDYIPGNEAAYIRLATVIRVKAQKTEQEDAFLAFCRKNTLI